MSEPKTFSRRSLLKRTVALPVIVGGGAFGFVACGGEEKKALVCTDTAGLAPADVQLRTAQAYADQSTDPAKKCSLCNFFEAGAPAACGTCKVIKGPVHPEGSCKLFAKKVGT